MAKLAAIQLLPPDKALSRWCATEKTDLAQMRRAIDPRSDGYDESALRAWLRHYSGYVMGMVARAGEAGVDLALLPETTVPLSAFLYSDVLPRFRDVADWSSAEFIAALAPVTRRYKMTVAACIYTVTEAGVANSGVLVGPDGEVIGAYHKTHLPCYEDAEGDEATEAGVVACGQDYPVFDTPAGRVGLMICYDVIFPEVARILALQGAEILLHPSVGYNFPDEEEVVGEARLRTRATENSAALVYANFGGPVGRSCVIDQRGTHARLRRSGRRGHRHRRG